MTRKIRHNPPKPKEFHSTHFDSLKRMVLPDAESIQPITPEVQKQEEQVDNGSRLFLQAVADVRPIHRNVKSTGQDADSFHKEKSEKTNGISPAEESAGNLFLEEISRLKLDTKFTDSVPDDGEMKPLPGNRLRQVKKGVISVDYQLDLHGLRRDEAISALPGFLRSALKKGQKAVLVITGKGCHSADEPVLQQAVASWLREAGRDLVVEFAPAPREMGGNGAFVVFLRSGAPRT